MKDCRRCGGSGTLVIKTGKPDPTRDTHAPYQGVWCITSSMCMVCKGYGKERDKPNPLAGWRIHLNNQGVPTKRSQIVNRKVESDGIFTSGTTGDGRASA